MLDKIRETHDRLDETSILAVREITNLAATMKVLESADDHSIRTAVECSADSLDCLAAFLDAVADGVDEAGESVDAGSLLGLAEELEPSIGSGVDQTSPSDAPTEEPDSGRSAAPFEDVSPLRRFSAPYSVLLNLERDLYANRWRRPFRVRKLKKLWGDLSRVGSSHPNDGLVARLGRFTEYVEDALDGRDVDLPWSDSDLEQVRSLADRAQTILEWDDEELVERERRAWLERVRNWVETVEDDPGSVRQLSEMLTRFLTDRPRAQSDDVVELLERIAELEKLPDDLEERTRSALDAYR